MITPAKHLAYAAGYLQLGLLDDARDELAPLSPENLATAPALTLRLELAMAADAWADVVTLAPDLVSLDSTKERPWVAWAYALRELNRVPEAQEILLAGSRLISDPSPLVDYNLACYASLTYLIDIDTPPASDTLTLAADDLGHTGSGTAASGSKSVLINIIRRNTSPQPHHIHASTVDVLTRACVVRLVIVVD